MKLVFISFLLLIIQFYSFSQDKDDEKILRVMSFNIRCGSCEDTGDVNYWSERKDRVFQLFKKYDPDIIGLQEAEIWQIKDIEKEFEEYKWIGAGRDDGKKSGEFTAVFYKWKRFNPWEYGTYWLSKSPDVPSKGWDAALNRTVTEVLFRDHKSELNFGFFNTHLDHMGEIARIESAKILRKRVNEYSGGYLPIIITGDFNFDENADGYKILTSGELEMEDLISSIEYDSLLNSQYVSEKPHYGGTITFNAFGKKTDIESPIDFIFVNKYVNVLSHRVIADTLEGLYPSDHFPVLVDILLKP